MHKNAPQCSKMYIKTQGRKETSKSDLKSKHKLKKISQQMHAKMWVKCTSLRTQKCAVSGVIGPSMINQYLDTQDSAASCFGHLNSTCSWDLKGKRHFQYLDIKSFFSGHFNSLKIISLRGWWTRKNLFIRSFKPLYIGSLEDGTGWELWVCSKVYMALSSSLV